MTGNWPHRAETNVVVSNHPLASATRGRLGRRAAYDKDGT